LSLVFLFLDLIIDLILNFFDFFFDDNLILMLFNLNLLGMRFKFLNFLKE